MVADDIVNFFDVLHRTDSTSRHCRWRTIGTNAITVDRRGRRPATVAVYNLIGTDGRRVGAVKAQEPIELDDKKIVISIK